MNAEKNSNGLPPSFEELVTQIEAVITKHGDSRPKFSAHMLDFGPIEELKPGNCKITDKVK